ncbi:helix-turn-helix domain-containing protein [Variovorax terrae]|uniref:Helix-turn-helix domain-containing protein n=1 Tax=Variovorax terrae TaxID=2923278 RepID=A0A9X1VUC7_9BURK|nr:helix-turn-helix domain-containing protein [Variovorax terrae]MCJ0763464.1 helix-turn-helix domain-containing protein [Variovorax terrae]
MNAAVLPLPSPPPSLRCPAFRARAARWAGSGPAPQSRLYTAPPALQGALVAVVCRDTRGRALDDAQRLSHFPASPLVCLSWYQDLDAGLVTETPEGASRWRPFAASVMLSGSQTAPTASWAPTTGRGGMLCFTLDAAQQLFGVDLVEAQDRFVPALDVLGRAWSPLCDALLAANDDAQTMVALQRHLAPRWREVLGRAGDSLPSLSEFGRHWVGRLGLQAREWQRTLGTRQVERRVKAFSGRSIREWQGMVRTEGLFHAARQRHAQGQPLDWPALALDEGFSDQAHMSRAVRQITGFAPTEFARRFEEDESFWMYRLWV